MTITYTTVLFFGLGCTKMCQYTQYILKTICVLVEDNWLYTHFTDINTFSKFSQFYLCSDFCFSQEKWDDLFFMMALQKKLVSEVCQSLYQISALETLNLSASLSSGPSNHHQHLLVKGSHDLGNVLSCVLFNATILWVSTNIISVL